MATLNIAEDYTTEVLVAKDKAVQKALAVIGLKAEKYAKQKCPVDTGRLRNSITNESDGQSMQVGTNVEYGPYVELGTSRMNARAFIGPSVEDHLQEYESIFREILENA